LAWTARPERAGPRRAGIRTRVTVGIKTTSRLSLKVSGGIVAISTTVNVAISTTVNAETIVTGAETGGSQCRRREEQVPAEDQEVLSPDRRRPRREGDGQEVHCRHKQDEEVQGRHKQDEEVRCRHKQDEEVPCRHKQDDGQEAPCRKILDDGQEARCRKILDDGQEVLGRRRGDGQKVRQRPAQSLRVRKNPPKRQTRRPKRRASWRK